MRNLLADLWTRVRNAVVVAWWRLENFSVAFWHWLRSAVVGVRLFIPIAFIALLLAGYTWWWQQIANSVRDSVGQFQLDQHAQGREASWDSFDVSGFPYRVQALVA